MTKGGAIRWGTWIKGRQPFAFASVCCSSRWTWWALRPSSPPIFLIWSYCPRGSKNRARQIITTIMRERMRMLNSAAATGVSGPRIDHFAPRTVEDVLNAQGPSPTDATATERQKKKATDVAIPVLSRIAVRRIELRRLRQSHLKERFVFSRVRACSKM